MDASGRYRKALEHIAWLCTDERIPDPEIMQEGLRQIAQICHEQLDDDRPEERDLLTMSEAAVLLYGNNGQSAIVAISNRVAKGQLPYWIKHSEPNPQRNKLLSRAAVMALKDKRK